MLGVDLRDGVGRPHLRREEGQRAVAQREPLRQRLGRVNYGASPGDAAVAEPYLYVGPYDGPPVRDAFWNAPFGAFVTRDEVATPEEALAFFRSGRSRLARLAGS